jgi:hypothetical protein
MLGTLSSRELAAQLGLHPSDREWRGNCPSCPYSDTSRRLSRSPRSLASARQDGLSKTACDSSAIGLRRRTIPQQR